MRAVVFLFTLAGAVFLALVAQFLIPELPGPWFAGARVLLMPIILFYGALVLPLPAVLVLCFVAGLLNDALTLPSPQPAEEGQAPVAIALGWSIVLYGFLGCIMNGVRPFFGRGRWEIHCLLTGFFTSLIVVAEYLVVAVKRVAEAGFSMPPAVWERALGSGIVATLLAPLFYFVLSTVARAIGYNPVAFIPAPQR